MITENDKMRPQDESQQVEASWYVAPKPPVPKGWLVFSEEFVLRVLQGSYSHHRPPRRTPAWRLLAVVVRGVMAVAQAVLMFLSVVPVVSRLIGFLAVHLGRGAMGSFIRSCHLKAKLEHLGQDTLIECGLELWGARGIRIGAGCHVDSHVRLRAGEGRYGQYGRVSIGDYSHIGPRCLVSGRGGVEIGDFVSIEAGVHLYSATNTLMHPDHPGQLISVSHTAPYGFQHAVESSVSIGDYAVVGFGSLIMPGASIGLGAIVHPHTQVTTRFPPFANIVGPGRARQNGWRRPARPDPRREPVPPGDDNSREQT